MLDNEELVEDRQIVESVDDLVFDVFASPATDQSGAGTDGQTPPR